MRRCLASLPTTSVFALAGLTFLTSSVGCGSDSAESAGSTGTTGVSSGGSASGGAGGSATGGGGAGGAPGCVIDGNVSATEQCDDGNLVDGDGCDSDCHYSCVDPLADCAAPPACQVQACTAQHTCQAVPDPTQDGTICGTGMVCQSGACIVPGNAVCGNGIREPGEQCDDGNTTNLDACDSVCKFEQDHRVNWFKMQFGTDTFCPADALGGAIGTTAQSTLQSGLDAGVADGSISILFKMLNLDDLTGTNDASVSLGVMSGVHVAGAGYNGASDLDWWYTADATSIDANRNPLSSLSGSIAANVLTAGPGSVTLSVLLAGSAGALKMSSTKVRATIGAASTPLTSTGAPPGHLAAEHLDPALVSFATAGQQTATGAGQLCGNVSASSLAQVPIPAALAAGGSTACDQNYAATNSLLDVFVGGCTLLSFITAIAPTQPDQVDPGAPAAGAGGPYKLSENAQHQVSTCKDKNNATVNLQACLTAAAYSTYFKFATDRVIIK